MLFLISPLARRLPLTLARTLRGAKAFATISLRVPIHSQLVLEAIEDVVLMTDPQVSIQEPAFFVEQRLGRVHAQDP